MNVRVHTFAHLRNYLPSGQGPAELTLADGATVADLFAALRIPATVEVVMIVNGRRADVPPRGCRHAAEQGRRGHAVPADGRRLIPARRQRLNPFDFI
jgi:hypothetical protein